MNNAASVTVVQEPGAREVIAHHQRVASGEAEAGSEATIGVYLQAGAHAEAAAAVQARLAGQPDDAYAEAIRVELACWDPADHAAGHAAATAWLAEHDTPTLTPWVEARAKWLEQQLGHRAEVADGSALARAWPLLALLIALGLAWGGWRLAARLVAPAATSRA